MVTSVNKYMREIQTRQVWEKRPTSVHSAEIGRYPRFRWYLHKDKHHAFGCVVRCAYTSAVTGLRVTGLCTNSRYARSAHVTCRIEDALYYIDSEFLTQISRYTAYIRSKYLNTLRINAVGYLAAQMHTKFRLEARINKYDFWRSRYGNTRRNMFRIQRS